MANAAITKTRWWAIPFVMFGQWLARNAPWAPPTLSPEEQFDELVRRKDRLYVDIEDMESTRKILWDTGKEATSNIVRRRLRDQIKLLDKDLNRANTMVKVLLQKIDIHSAHYSNTALAAEANRGDIPNQDVLVESAVGAEDALAGFEHQADLVATIDVAGSRETEDDTAELDAFFSDEPAAPEATEPEPDEEETTAAEAQPYKVESSSESV